LDKQLSTAGSAKATIPKGLADNNPPLPGIAELTFDPKQKLIE